MVVNWERDGDEIKNLRDTKTGKLLSRPQNLDFNFRSGLTWSDRTTSLFSSRVWVAGGVFSVKGSAGFFKNDELYVIGLMNSLLFNNFLVLLVGAGDAAARSYQVGVIGSVPYPINNQYYDEIIKITFEIINLKRYLDISNEINHIFCSPAFLLCFKKTLKETQSIWHQVVLETNQKISEYQEQIDYIVYHLYGISEEDRKAIESTLNTQTLTGEEKIEDNENEIETTLTIKPQQLTDDLISYTVGCIYGRWDIRFATGEKQPPELPDPFAPLPPCSPGMLTGEDGLPLTATPDNYPLQIDWDGILVDDPDHPDDIIRRIQDVLEIIWGDKAEAIEQYVEPKLRLEESNLEHLRAQKTAAGDTGKQAKQLEKQIDRQEAFISELNDFADKLRRAANLNLAPDLNDGVVLNIAPLWELVPWSEAKTYWQELTQGKYEWSSIGKQLREKGIVQC